ncbi:SDR family oxidoreductase [Streptomyces sp. NPDC021139]|uniref:SDR family oxidoreductase n=1 Tax=unclassified Streptomyces TaxID=2593676 RepID=UPI0007504D53
MAGAGEAVTRGGDSCREALLKETAAAHAIIDVLAVDICGDDAPGAQRRGAQSSGSRSRVRVNSVAPGPTRTDVMLHAGPTPEAANDMYAYERDRIPTHHIAHADEVAHWILRMADPAGRRATGRVITVDSGLELI